MPKEWDKYQLDEVEEPLVDTTVTIPLHSKRISRQQKKRHHKKISTKQTATFLDLPSELMIQVLTLLTPRDAISLQRTSKPLRNFILSEESRIANAIIVYRYAVLTKCFPRPVLLANVDAAAHSDLLSEERLEMMGIHKRPYQHVQAPDHTLVCTCLTCMLAWNNLNLIIDFASWQQNLNSGEPIPMLPRGKAPSWNKKHIFINAGIVVKALSSPLYYARILQAHLQSTVGSIKRHGENKGNKRRRFRMEKDDVEAGTDVFLERSGPPSLDFPFSRDNYYMLEAYLPNRGWSSEREAWVYMPDTQHERDVEFVRGWTRRRQETKRKEAEAREAERRLELASEIMRNDGESQVIERLDVVDGNGSASSTV